MSVIQANRVDVACCVQLDKDENLEKTDGLLYTIFKRFYAPALLTDWVRPIVVSTYQRLRPYSPTGSVQ